MHTRQLKDLLNTPFYQMNDIDQISHKSLSSKLTQALYSTNQAGQ